MRSIPHLDIDTFHDKEKLSALKSQMHGFFEERAKFFFGDHVRVQIEFEEGSLKTRITVLGVAATVLYNAIAGYGSFRQGVDQISKDATLLAQSANLEMIYRTRAAYCDRVNIERRRGVFGRIDDLMGRIATIQTTLAKSDMPQKLAQLKEFERGLEALILWDQDSDRLFTKLDSHETKACVAAGFLEELERVPTTPAWEQYMNTNSFRISIAKSDPDFHSKLSGAAERYKTAAKSIKQKMKERLAQLAPKKA